MEDSTLEMETNFGGRELRSRHSRDDGMEEKILGKDHKKHKAFDHNEFATRKTVAKGLMDVALLSANASQMKVCLQLGKDRQEFFYLLMSLLSISIVLQAVVAILLIILGKANINSAPDGGDTTSPKQSWCKRINNAATALVFVITFLNVLISSFGISERIDVDKNAVKGSAGAATADKQPQH